MQRINHGVKTKKFTLNQCKLVKLVFYIEHKGPFVRSGVLWLLWLLPYRWQHFYQLIVFTFLDLACLVFSKLDKKMKMKRQKVNYYSIKMIIANSCLMHVRMRMSFKIHV